jgi:hypothetical protein
MSSDAIYLLSDSGELRRIEHEFYATEDILQELIARYPDVLAGDQIDPDSPPRWLLIRREATIPDSVHGEDRWWLDHLLLDQFAIPTLVEVKRSSDTRIRREVVGQMLDYVANAQAYWAAGRMRQMLTDQMGSPELADARLAEHLGVSGEAETVAEQIERFWNKIEANLRAGNVRLLFVADELPRELKRLIEFLNEQFSNIEVLGVELRQYVGQGVKALVPRVIGQSEAAREQKARSSPSRSAAPSVRLNRERFLSICPSEAMHFFAKILDEAANRGLAISWGTTSFNVRKKEQPLFVWCYAAKGIFEVNDGALPEEQARRLRSQLLNLSSAQELSPVSIRIYVTRETQSDAQKAWEIVLQTLLG